MSLSCAYALRKKYHKAFARQLRPFRFAFLCYILIAFPSATVLEVSSASAGSDDARSRGLRSGDRLFAALRACRELGDSVPSPGFSPNAVGLCGDHSRRLLFLPLIQATVRRLPFLSKPLSCEGFIAATGSCDPWDVVSTRLGRTGEESAASGSQV